MTFADCPECDAQPKKTNLENHVRDVHPRSYLEHYPEACSNGWQPCDECWEWFHVSGTETVGLGDARAEIPALEHHVASEHPEFFAEMFPDECLLCALGYHWPRWPHEDEDFIWRDGEVDFECAALLLSDRHGVELTAEMVREHTHDVEPSFGVSQGNKLRVALAEFDARPTRIESSVIEELEEGEEATAAEIAERCGYTARGVRERADDMVDHGILEVADAGRPTVYRATGGSIYPEPKEEPSELPEVPWDEAGTRFGTGGEEVLNMKREEH